MVEPRWARDGIAIFPVAGSVVVDTFNHSDEPASLTPDEARSAAAALAYFAEVAEAHCG